VDVKTLLLLGVGMLVLALVAFCSVQSHAASIAGGGVEAPLSTAGSRPVSAHNVDTSRFVMKGKIPAAHVGANR